MQARDAPDVAPLLQTLYRFSAFDRTIDKLRDFVHYLKNYFKHTVTYSTIRFIIESYVVATFFKFLLAFLIGGLSIAFNSKIEELPASAYQDEPSATVIFVFLCIITPILETIIFQWVPIKLLAKITPNISLIIGIDALIFTAVHWFIYGFPMFIIVLPFGIILAWGFFMNSKDSLSKAFWVTFFIHMLGNLLAFYQIAST